MADILHAPRMMGAGPNGRRQPRFPAGRDLVGGPGPRRTIAVRTTGSPPLGAGTGGARFDALSAAIAEDLCVRAGVSPPSWVHGRDRFLDRFWWVVDLPSARANALVHAPASYRRRGVMLDRSDLEAA